MDSWTGDQLCCKAATYTGQHRHRRNAATEIVWYIPVSTCILIPKFVISETESACYCDHYWPVVPAPDDRWWWLWSNWWNGDWQGKPKYSEKTYPSATLSTTNPTWRDPGSNPAAAVGSQRLTAWAMTRPFSSVLFPLNHSLRFRVFLGPWRNQIEWLVIYEYCCKPNWVFTALLDPLTTVCFPWHTTNHKNSPKSNFVCMLF
jgi:hypothetical protein